MSTVAGKGYYLLIAVRIGVVCVLATGTSQMLFCEARLPTKH